MSACPFSSKAITTAAAPYCLIIRACSRNLSSPSFREIELTIDFPWRHFNPASITSHLEESIITGTRAISGSDMIRLRNVVISALASSNPSSILTSITKAPSSTCWRAIDNASSYFFSFIRRRNLREPATLQRSPTFTKFISGFTSNSSRPESHIQSGLGAGICGRAPSTRAGYSAIYASVVPQQPPIILINPSWIYSFTSWAISAGVWSYLPRLFGKPAFG